MKFNFKFGKFLHIFTNKIIERKNFILPCHSPPLIYFICNPFYPCKYIVFSGSSQKRNKNLCRIQNVIFQVQLHYREDFVFPMICIPLTFYDYLSHFISGILYGGGFKNKDIFFKMLAIFFDIPISALCKP